MYFQSHTLSGPENYQLLVGGVVPRPIAWISTIDADGVTNLAPYSFFTVASCQPPVLVFTHVNPRDGHSKDTLSNLRATGECVVNLVSADLVNIMNASCAEYPPDVSEFSALGIETVASCAVVPPGVAAARIRYECCLREIKMVGPTDLQPSPLGGTMVFLDVLGVHVNDALLLGDGVALDHQALQATGKLGGDYYTGAAQPFSLGRPKL